MVGPDRGMSYGGLVGEWTSLVVWDGAVGFMSFWSGYLGLQIGIESPSQPFHRAPNEADTCADRGFPGIHPIGDIKS
jgi:hypothetical protein